MANNIRTLAVGTVQDLENHDATRSRWGCSAAKTPIENSISTPLRHLPPSHLRGLHPRRSLDTRPAATPIGGGQGGDRRGSHAQRRRAYRPYATNICNKLALDCMGTHGGHVTYSLR